MEEPVKDKPDEDENITRAINNGVGAAVTVVTGDDERHRWASWVYVAAIVAAEILGILAGLWIVFWPTVAHGAH